jgi:thioredoxin 1
MDNINILKINVDEYPDLAQKYGIMSIPTLCFFSNGEIKKKEIGYRNVGEIKEIVTNIKKEID